MIQKILRTTFLGFSLLYLHSAAAEPRVGDMVILEGARIKTLQEITGYSEDTALFTLRQTQIVDGRSEEKEVQVAKDDLLTEEAALEIVKECEAQSIGKFEKLKVSAGTFETCRVSSGSGSTLWISAVPFGVVMLETPFHGDSVRLKLTSYRRGK